MLGSIRWLQVFEVDEIVQSQIARLTSDIVHIKSDLADIKMWLRRVEDRHYRLEERLTDRVQAIRSDLSETIERFRREIK